VKDLPDKRLREVPKERKRERAPSGGSAKRKDPLKRIYLIVAIVGTLVTLVFTIRTGISRDGSRSDDSAALADTRELMDDLKVPKIDSPLIEALANDFVVDFPNPPRETVKEYLRLKKGTISHVRFFATRRFSPRDATRVEIERALPRADVDAVRRQMAGSDTSETSRETLAANTDVRLLFRAHLAILLDEPRTAAKYFQLVAARREEEDPQGAKYLLADGADHLSRVGCVQGKEWLDTAILLYEQSLQEWPKNVEEAEWAVTQNNLGAARLLLALRHAEGEEELKAIRRSVDSLRKAAEIVGRSWVRPDPRLSIVYGNLEEAITELWVFADRDPVLRQEIAVAERYLIANETQALGRRGLEGMERLRSASQSTQISPGRESTLARHLNVATDGDPCRRPW
jgi:hypothetical protein